MKQAIFVVTYCVCIGCQSYLATPKKQSDCVTTLSGFFKSPPIFIGQYPAVILKRNDNQILHGAIVEVSSDFVLFDENKGSYLIDPEVKKYSFSETAAIIDQEGNLLYGVIPKKYLLTWSAELEIKKDGGASQLTPTRFRLIPNQPFSYCIEAGSYETGILFLVSDRSRVQLCMSRLRFAIVENVNNYLGMVILDEIYQHDSTIAIHLPCIAQKPVGGGGVGAAIDLLTPTRNVDHTLVIDTSFVGGRRPNDVLIKIQSRF